jgi:hypothetical protein
LADGGLPAVHNADPAAFGAVKLDVFLGLVQHLGIADGLNAFADQLGVSARRAAL